MILCYGAVNLFSLFIFQMASRFPKRDNHSAEHVWFCVCFISDLSLSQWITNTFWQHHRECSTMGHGSWVKYSVGHMGHGSLKVTHRLRKCFLVIHCIYNILHFRFGWWKPKPVLASKLLGSRISQLFLENFWFLVVWNRMFWCIVGRLDVGPVIRSRIRISDYCSNSLAIAGYGILRDLLASSHTVAGRFSRNSLKWLKPTRKWSTTFWSASAAETWMQINPGIWIRIPDHCWLRQRKFKGSGQKCEFSNCSVRLS